MHVSETIELALRSCLCALLVTLVAIPPQLTAQSPVPPAQVPPPAIAPMAPLPMVRSLKVVALAGNGEMNDLERRVMAPVVIEVRDQNDRPVEGADVIFRFPPEGPGATFPDHKYSQKARSNAQGQAAATGWMANNQTGSFKIHVTATFIEQMGEATLSLTNATRVVENAKKKHEAKPWWSSRWAKIGIIAGAAGLVTGIVLATTGSNGSPNVTISTGSPTIGGPR